MHEGVYFGNPLYNPRLFPLIKTQYQHTFSTNAGVSLWQVPMNSLNALNLVAIL